MNLIDPDGLMPNQPFSSPDAAAKDAYHYYRVNYKSNNWRVRVDGKWTYTNREIGGWIYKLGDTWSYPEAVIGTEDGKHFNTSEFTKIPDGAERVGLWHTHQGDHYNVDWWSTFDYLQSSRHGILYMLLDADRIKRLNQNEKRGQREIELLMP